MNDRDRNDLIVICFLAQHSTISLFQFSNLAGGKVNGQIVD